MRRRQASSARPRRAPAREPGGASYDQLMTLHAPRSPGTDAYVRIYNSDGSEAGACGNGMRCVAELLFNETGKNAPSCWRPTAGCSAAGRAKHRWYQRSTWASRALAGRRFRSPRQFHDTRAIELQIGPIDKPILHSPSVGQHGKSACGLLGRRRRRLRPRPDRPAAREPPDLPGPGQYLAGAGAFTRARGGAHLGARCRPHQGVRLGCLRGGGRGRAAGPRPDARRR